MLSFIILPIILSFLFFSSQPIVFDNPVEGVKPNVLFLTAHPDDECMFFAPTIISLVEQGTKVVGLSLSNGNAEGLGKIREGELKKSYDVLGVPEHHVQSLDLPWLQDTMKEEWHPVGVANLIHEYVSKYHITTVLTFDDRGVSQHPNHISLFHGAATWFSANNHNASSPSLYLLKSVSLSRKYNGIWSPLSTRVISALEGIIMPGARPSQRSMVSSFEGYKTALRAMRQHKTQLVWFRWLYVAFSRYMWVNEWEQVVR